MKKREQFDERLHAYLNGNLETEYLYEYPLGFEEKEAPYAEVYGKLSKLPNTISQVTSKRIHEMIRQRTHQNPQMCHILNRIKSYEENLTIKQNADPLLQKTAKIDIVEVLADHKDIIRGKRWVNKFRGQQKLEMATDNLKFGQKDFNRNSYMISGYTKPKIAHPNNKLTVPKHQTPEPKPKTPPKSKTTKDFHKFRVSKGKPKQQTTPDAPKPTKPHPNPINTPSKLPPDIINKSHNSPTASYQPSITRRPMSKESITPKDSEKKIKIKNSYDFVEVSRPKNRRKHSFYVDQLMRGNKMD